MTAAMARHWTGLDAALIGAEAAGVLALVVLVPWLWDRGRKSRSQPPVISAARVTIQARATEPYDSPAWTAGASTTGEDPQ